MKKRKQLTISQQLWNKRVDDEYKGKKMVKKKDNEFDDGLALLSAEFFDLKKQFSGIDTNETIKKWKILSKAYQLGKEIYGHNYSVQKLSKDFDIPYTTAKRVLSLDKATEKTWERINNDAISAFKVAQICMTKNNKYQDEIVEMVIKDNLSTSDITKLRVGNKGDINVARLNTALKKGFARKDVAYRSLRDTLLRLSRLLRLKKSDFPASKIEELYYLMRTARDKLINKVTEFH